MKTKQLFALILSLSLFAILSTSSVYARRDPVDNVYPVDVRAGISQAYDKVTDILYLNNSWYLLTSADGLPLQRYFYITQYDYYFQNILRQNSFDMSSSYNVADCQDLQFINSTHVHFMCFNTFVVPTFRARYWIVSLVDWSNVYYDTHSYGGTFTPARLSNLGAGVTGSQDVHTAYIEEFGTLERGRNLKSGYVEDTYPMPTISALYDFIPFQSISASGSSCFHDAGTDCGSWLVYTATTSGDPNRRLYVNEYSTGVCTFNPSNFCYFSAELLLYHTKKVITDQEVTNIDVYKGINYWEVTYQDFNTAKWWLAYFDEEWNLISRYEIQDDNFAPFKVYDSGWTTTSCGAYCFTAYIENVDLPAEYDKIPLLWRYYINSSGVTPEIEYRIEEQGNSSHYLSGTENLGNKASTGWATEFEEVTLPSDFQNISLKVNLTIYKTAGVGGFNQTDPRLEFFATGSEANQKMDIGLEDKRVWIWSGQKYYNSTYDPKTQPYAFQEEEICTCNPYTIDGCYDNQRKSTRVCYPPACDDEVKFEYDVTCVVGECAPTRYRCYNETALCLWKSDCTWDLSDCTDCLYTCDQANEKCYDSPTCPQCPNEEMVQREFPDCSCSCENFCAIGYENLTVSCACKSMVIDTDEWQDNPVQMFKDVSSGMVAMFSGIAVPLALILLAIAFAGIITMIMKKSIK